MVRRHRKAFLFLGLGVGLGLALRCLPRLSAQAGGGNNGPNPATEATKRHKLQDFLGLLDRFDFWFAIITANPPLVAAGRK
jgi:hypothetical protein